jgi:hypothetical protein
VSWGVIGVGLAQPVCGCFCCDRMMICERARPAARLSAGFGGTLDAQTILDFVDSGHNVLLAASSDVSEAMRGLAAEFGVDLDDKGTKVFDHFSHGSIHGAEDHTLVASSDLVDSPVMTGGPYTVRGCRGARGTASPGTVAATGLPGCRCTISSCAMLQPKPLNRWPPYRWRSGLQAGSATVCLQERCAMHAPANAWHMLPPCSPT